MSGSLKLALVVIASVVAIGIALKLLAFVWHLVWGILVPVAVLVAIGYIVYLAVGRKSLGGGRRRYLP